MNLFGYTLHFLMTPFRLVEGANTNLYDVIYTIIFIFAILAYSFIFTVLMHWKALINQWRDKTKSAKKPWYLYFLLPVLC